MKESQIMGTLLKAARRAKVHPQHLQDFKVDYSSAYRVLHGKATRPSLAMAVGLAAVTGHKLKLVKARKPKLREILTRASPKKRAKSTKRARATKRRAKSAKRK